jgi:hypothetical protein
VGNSVKKVWEINPKEAEAVRLVYKMHAEGYGSDTIIPNEKAPTAVRAFS